MQRRTKHSQPALQNVEIHVEHSGTGVYELVQLIGSLRVAGFACRNVMMWSCDCAAGAGVPGRVASVRRGIGQRAHPSAQTQATVDEYISTLRKHSQAVGQGRAGAGVAPPAADLAGSNGEGGGAACCSVPVP